MSRKLCASSTGNNSSKQCVAGIVGILLLVGASALWHVNEFTLDDSKVGFLGDSGIGYKFSNSGRHPGAKGEHISNGGMGDKNGGISGLGLAAGHSLWRQVSFRGLVSVIVRVAHVVCPFPLLAVFRGEVEKPIRRCVW